MLDWDRIPFNGPVVLVERCPDNWSPVDEMLPGTGDFPHYQQRETGAEDDTYESVPFASDHPVRIF